MQSFTPHFPLGNEDFGATRDNSSASSAPNDDGKTQLTEDQIKILHKLMHSSQSQEIHLEPDHTYRQLPQDTKPQVAPRPRTAWLQTRVHEKPRDAEPWIELISLVRVAKDHDKIVDTYEAALQAFPNTPSLQISYLRHVSESSVPTKWQTVATLLNRFLKTSPFPELWRFYISHVRKVNSKNVKSAHGTVRKAYEFALNHVGHDPESGDIWSDYIHFLKTVEADIWNEGCQTDVLRMAYQCAIQAPTAHANKLWQQYCEFEAAAADPQSVEKIIAAHQVVHTQACKAYGALQPCVGDLFSAPTADQDLLRLPRVPIFFADEKALMSKWRQYLKWEEGNPLSYDDHARSRLYTRVQAAYRKAVVLMRFYPEVWYMAYAWTNLVANEPGLPDSKREEKKDEAMEYLKSGVHANPRSFVLNFAYAEVLEEANDLPAVHDVYQTFISALRTELEAEGSQGSPVTGTLLDDPSSQPSKFMGKADMKDDKRTQFGTAWIMYMRFARRAESSKAARDVFSKARKDNWVTWKVYEAAALMEYHCTKAADVATRIFHKAMEKFPTEEQLALQYLEFLISINDDSNARALFERVIAMFAPEKARVLWNRWMRYEYQYGTFPATQELEKRIAQVYPNESPIKRFADRHKYLNVDTIAVRDLGFRLGPLSDRTPNSQQVITPHSSQETTRTTRSSSSSKRRLSASIHDSFATKHKPFDLELARDKCPYTEFTNKQVMSDGLKSTLSCPEAISWFLSMLPVASLYEGPLLRTDDMMQLLLNMTIPSSTGIGVRPQRVESAGIHSSLPTAPRASSKRYWSR